MHRLSERKRRRSTVLVELSHSANVIEEVLAGAEPEVGKSDYLGARDMQYPIDAEDCPWAKVIKSSAPLGSLTSL